MAGLESIGLMVMFCSDTFRSEREHRGYGFRALATREPCLHEFVACASGSNSGMDIVVRGSIVASDFPNSPLPGANKS